MPHKQLPQHPAQSIDRPIAEKPSSSAGSLRGKALWFNEITHPTSSDDLIKGVIGAGGLSMIYGPTGCGKSFLATDMALSVARSVATWFGRRVNGGGVLYIAAEGQSGFRKRISAYRMANLTEETTSVPFCLLPVPVNLLRGDDAGELVKLVLELAEERAPIRLVKIDTLARTIIGGDENDSQDMGSYIASLGELQAKTGAHVCVIHHTGKNVANGARGHSSLLAAVDTAIEVSRDGDQRTATVVKQKDGREGDVIAFTLETIDVDTDEDGDPITSCVIRPAEQPAPAPKATKLSPSQRRALDLLREAINTAAEKLPAQPHMPVNAIGVKVDVWRRYCDSGALTDSTDLDTRRRMFGKCRDALLDKGVIGTWDGWVWLT